MPIYEYECPKCGRFEIVQKVSDKPAKAKPDCSDKKCPCSAKRILSPAAFHLKGAGWYKTDYASGSKVDSSKKDTESTGSSSSTPKVESSEKGTPSTKKKGSGGCGSGCGCH